MTSTLRRSMHRPVALLLALALTALGCDDCFGETFVPYPEPTSMTDAYAQKEAAQVDILWIIDNSVSMEAEQNKIADRFSQFFKQLLISRVNFHIGIVTTDPAEGGKLHQYTGTAVAGCDGCRFITQEVPCPNADVTFNPGTPEADIEAGLLTACPAQLVFRKLIRVGNLGANYEEGFTQAATALGAMVDPNTGGPQLDTQGSRIVPVENAGFVRNSASLYLIFVSDENDGSKGPVRYFYRLYEGLKYAGNENRIAVSAITGWPSDAQGVAMTDVCGILATSFNSDAGDDDPKLATVADLLTGGSQCKDPTDNSANAFAAVGARQIELACRTGGVLADICSNDYSTALDALGANAAGLMRKFPLSKGDSVFWGTDCKPFTEDDQFIACGAETAEDHASPLCVIGTPLSGGDEQVVPQSDVSGWRYESSTMSVRFDGTFIPAPGSELRISYRLRPSSVSCP